MSNYRMTLIVGGREINIPVLPAKLNVSSPGKNERVTVLDLGEVLLLRKKGLRILSWESFFPADSAPYTTGQVRDPISIIQAIQKARDSKTPVRFLITGTDLECNIRMGIESFEYEERSANWATCTIRSNCTNGKTRRRRKLSFRKRRTHRRKPRNRPGPESLKRNRKPIRSKKATACGISRRNSMAREATIQKSITPTRGRSERTRI